jgi:acyl-ACP thioesterase
MKIETVREINFFDIDSDQTLRVDAMARFFQEMATLHSIRVGAGPEVLFSRGVIWFLNRLEIQVVRYPLLGEKLKITTWSRGFRRHTGLREYCIESEKGLVAKGSSVWIFFDVHRKKIMKVPADIESLYQFEPEKGFEDELVNWKTCGKIEPEKEQTISLRYGDFDVNGHVNNTIYLGFIETLFHKTSDLRNKRLGNVKIRFAREISRSAESVLVGCNRVNGRYRFNIYDPNDGNRLYADGEFIAMD